MQLFWEYDRILYTIHLIIKPSPEALPSYEREQQGNAK